MSFRQKRGMEVKRKEKMEERKAGMQEEGT